MLIPKQRLINISEEGNEPVFEVKYAVYDTDDCAFVENKIFGVYNTKEECQNAINFCNGFRLVS